MKFYLSKYFKFLLPIVLGAVLLFCAANANAGLLDGITNTLTKNAGQIGIAAGLMGLFLASSQGCWFCDLYSELFDTMNSLAGMVAKGLNHDFLVLLGVGMLFYLVFKIGSTVVKLQEVDLMQFLGELFKHMGRAIIAAAFLMGSIEMYKYFVSPFLAYALALTNAIVTEGKSSIDTGMIQGFLDDAMGWIFDFDLDGGDIKPLTGNAVEAKSALEPFSDELKNQIVGLLRMCSISAISGMITGAFVIVLGLADTVLFPNFQLLIIGLIIFGAYFSVFLALPFKLIDVMVRLAFVAALTPLWIVLWVFPATTGYTKNAWEMLLNCCACFICLGVVMVMVFQIMSQMNPLTNTSSLLEIGLSALFSGAGFNLFKNLNILSPAILKTLALGMLATSMIKGSSQIATQIVKSYGANIGDGMDKQMAQSMKDMGGIGAMLGGATMGALGNGGQGLVNLAKGLGGTVNSDVKAYNEGQTRAKAQNQYTPTAAPQNPTAAPQNPTAAPQNPTAAPQNPTAAPQNPTPAP